MAICCAIKKHGYSNFSLTILEYCEPSKCLEREKYFFPSGAEGKIIEPWVQYSQGSYCSNIWTYSFWFYKKNNVTFPPFGGVGGVWDAHKGIIGENHPRFGQNHSDDTKKK